MRGFQFLVFLIAFSSIQCFSDTMKKNLLLWQRQCLDETNVNKNMVINALVNHRYPDEAQFKKFLVCLAKKSGTIDDEGRIIPEALKQLLIDEGQSESAANDIVRKCTVVKDTTEDTAFNLFVCYQRKAPKDLQVEK